MAQYIDKSIVVAELKRRIDFCDKLADAAAEKNLCNTMEANELLIEQFGNLLYFLDTLEVKEVNFDFEQELYKAFGQVKDFTLGMRIAKHFYKLGLNAKI